MQLISIGSIWPVYPNSLAYFIYFLSCIVRIFGSQIYVFLVMTSRPYPLYVYCTIKVTSILYQKFALWTYSPFRHEMSLLYLSWNILLRVLTYVCRHCNIKYFHLNKHFFIFSFFVFSNGSLNGPASEVIRFLSFFFIVFKNCYGIRNNVLKFQVSTMKIAPVARIWSWCVIHIIMTQHFRKGDNIW